VDDPVVRPNGRIDVKELMGQIRERIRRRRDVSTDAEIDAVVSERLQGAADAVDIDPDLMMRLLGADPDWNVAPDYRIETHRSGLGAALVIALKRLVRAPVRLYTDPIIRRQAQLNLYLVRLCEGLVRELVRLEGANAVVERRCHALEARLRGTAGRIPEP
jgi:hypothetical protein